MNETQKLIYIAMLKKRHEILMSSGYNNCQELGFDEPKDMLDDYDADWLAECVCYDQWYLEWMQYAMSLLK